MKKWFIFGSVAAVAILAVSVYAFQNKVSTGDPGPQISADLRTTDCSGCATSSSGCGTVSGGCGRTASSPEKVQNRLQRIEAYFVDYYSNKQGLADITVEVESFGCHEEATVRQAGQVIARFSISGDNISQIEG